MKKCTKCNLEKDLCFFRLRKGKNNKKYYVSYCIYCEREQKRKCELKRYKNLTSEEKEHRNKLNSKYRKTEKYKSWHRSWQKNKEEVDISFKLKRRFSSQLRYHLNKNNDSFKMLNFTIEDLKKHLEHQFEDWMNWDNWGAYKANEWDDNDKSTWTWQIDHIVPASSFNYNSETDDQFIKCWSLNNLRPLSSKENIFKGVKHG